MSKFCRNCGAKLDSAVKFCPACGVSLQVEKAQSPQPLADTPFSKTKKLPLKKLPLKKLGISALALVLVLALGLSFWPKEGVDLKISQIGGDVEQAMRSFIYNESDYDTKAKTVKLSPDKPKASAYGVDIDFGEYTIEEEQSLQIKELPEMLYKDDGVKVTAYDFDLEGRHAFDDVITIAIPYDKKYAESGAEAECIGAKYYNQETGEWEGVDYALDVKNRQVLIYTTHLSTYGVFQVKNPDTRKAYITDVYPIAALLGKDRSFEVIKELAEEGQPGNVAFEAGLGAVNYVVGNTGTAVTATTLGGQYDGELVKSLGEGTQHLGLALAVVQTCYDFTYNFSDDQGKLSTLANLSKNIANNAVGYFGSAALQTAFAGIAVFDVILSTVQSDMVELKLENIGEVYQYYNDVEAPRSTKEWRRIFIKILSEQKDNPDAAKRLIDAEINAFCDRFWKLGYGKVKEIAGVSGKKYAFDERAWTKDREVLTAQYKAHLLTRLQAPLTSARNYLLKQALEQAQKEFEKRLRMVQKELNKVVQVEIIEEPEKEGDYQYGGYTLRFADLAPKADVKSWSFKMPKDGVLKTGFTILGHLQSGLPNRVELYKPGEDSPTLSVPFKVYHPLTTIHLNSSGQQEIEDKKEQSPSSGNYAWVLVDTVNYDGKTSIESTNSNGVYQISGTASPSSYSSTWKYLGESDTYYDPDKLHGENYAVQCTYSTPPATIQAGELVSLSLSLNFTANDISFYNASASASADFDKWDVRPGSRTRSAIGFKNADGKGHFEIFSSKTQADKNLFSVSETLSALAPSGSVEGDRIAIRTTYYSGTSLGTNYIYEWRKIS